MGILPPELEEWYCTKKEDKRLMPNEYWHLDDGGDWQICQMIHGVYVPTFARKKPHYPIFTLGDETDNEDDTYANDNAAYNLIINEGRVKYKLGKMTAGQRRINVELMVERLKWDSNKGCIKCNLRDNMSWELEQEREIVNHMTYKHAALSKLKRIKCPYCPKTLSEKRTMLIHLRIAEQRGGNAYDIM